MVVSTHLFQVLELLHYYRSTYQLHTTLRSLSQLTNSIETMTQLNSPIFLTRTNREKKSIHNYKLGHETTQQQLQQRIFTEETKSLYLYTVYCTIFFLRNWRSLDTYRNFINEKNTLLVRDSLQVWALFFLFGCHCSTKICFLGPFGLLNLGWNWLKNTVLAEMLWEKNTVSAEKRSRTSRIWDKPNEAFEKTKLEYDNSLRKTFSELRSIGSNHPRSKQCMRLMHATLVTFSRSCLLITLMTNVSG